MATGSATAATPTPEGEQPDDLSGAVVSESLRERTALAQDGDRSARLGRVRTAVAVATLTVTEVGLLYLFAYFVVEILL